MESDQRPAKRADMQGCQWSVCSRVGVACVCVRACVCVCVCVSQLRTCVRVCYRGYLQSLPLGDSYASVLRALYKCYSAQVLGPSVQRKLLCGFKCSKQVAMRKRYAKVCCASSGQVSMSKFSEQVLCVQR